MIEPCHQLVMLNRLHVEILRSRLKTLVDEVLDIELQASSLEVAEIISFIRKDDPV